MTNGSDKNTCDFLDQVELPQESYCEQESDSEITQDSARTSIFNQLGYPVFIDGTTSQKGGFQQFLGELVLTSFLYMKKG